MRNTKEIVHEPNGSIGERPSQAADALPPATLYGAYRDVGAAGGFQIVAYWRIILLAGRWHRRFNDGAAIYMARKPSMLSEAEAVGTG